MTPTADEVRSAWVWEQWGGYSGNEWVALETVFDAWIAERDRAVAEKAWAEGFDTGTTHGIAFQAGADDALHAANPYRREEQP